MQWRNTNICPLSHPGEVLLPEAWHCITMLCTSVEASIMHRIHQCRGAVCAHIKSQNRTKQSQFKGTYNHHLVQIPDQVETYLQNSNQGLAHKDQWWCCLMKSPAPFWPTEIYRDSCLARRTKQRICMLGFYAFPCTNILRTVKRTDCFPMHFQTQQFVSPSEVSSAERKPFVITHPFSQSFLWQAIKGVELTSPMDLTQHVRLFGKVETKSFGIAEVKYPTRLCKKILSCLLLMLHFQYWSRSSLCPSWQVS